MFYRKKIIMEEQISNSHKTSLFHKDIDKLAYIMQMAL